MFEYLPRICVDYLSVKNHRFGDPWRLNAHGAVLFADISGFVGLTEALTRKDPRGSQHLIRIFDNALRNVALTVGKQGGDILSIVGDSFLAFWPEADSAAASILCAAQCAEELHRTTDTLQNNHSAPKFRAAISFGRTEISGVGGCNKRMLLAATGAAINEACSNFHNAEPGQTVICRSAKNLLNNNNIQNRLAESQLRPPENFFSKLNIDEPLANSSDTIQQLHHFLPTLLTKYLDEGNQKWLAQFRKVSSVFVCHQNAFETLQELHDFVLDMQAIIYCRGGSVDQIIVDDKGISCLGAFGLPGGSDKDDAVRAVQAALDVQEMFGGGSMPVRVGVGSGLLYCGDVGYKTRRHFALYGPSVNLAARLAFVDQGVACDKATAEATTHVVKFVRYTLAADDKRLPLRQYFVPLEARPTPIVRTRHFVGRTAEITEIKKRIRSLTHTQSSIVILSGEPGIGKTRLLYEALALARNSGIRVVDETISNSETDAPLELWLRILRKVSGKNAEPEDEPLAVAPDDDCVTPETWAARFKLEVIRTLQEKCPSPLVIGIDNLHWVEPSSLDLLDEVLTALPGCLVITTASPRTPREFETIKHSWHSAMCHTMQLGPLSRADLATQVKAVLNADAIASDLIERLYTMTAGHPLFCEELALAMKVSGGLRISDGTAILSDVDDTERAADAAPSLNGAIAMRLDQLSWEQQLILKSASAFGQKFNGSDLRAVISESGLSAGIEDDVAVLVDAAFLDAKPGGTLQFKHAITRDVIYGQLPEMQRQELHRAAYRTLFDRLEGNNFDTALLAEIIDQAEYAGQAADALRHIETLVSYSLARYANLAAIRLQRRAFTIAKRHQISLSAERRALWWRNIGDAHQELSEYKMAAKAYRIVLRLLRDTPPSSNSRLVLSSAVEVARQTVHRCLPHGRIAHTNIDRKTADLKAHAYQRLAEIAFFQNKALSVLQHTLRAANLAEAAGLMPRTAISHASLSIGLGLNGMGRLAHFYRNASLNTADQTDDDAIRAYSRLLVTVLAFGQGDWKTIDEIGTEAALLYLRVGDEYRNHQVRFIQFYADVLTGNPQRAKTRLRQISRSDTVQAFQQTRFWYSTSALLLDTLWGRTNGAQIKELQLFGAANLDLPDRMMGFGISALAWSRQGEASKALAAAKVASELLIESPPTIGGGYLFGATGAVEVLLHYAADGSLPEPQQSALMNRATEALGALKTYTRRVPVSRPRVCLLQGAAAILAGNEKQAQSHWFRGVRAAEEMGMELDRVLLVRSLDAGRPVFAEAGRALLPERTA
ncbi:AAA family ATPase [Ruegeria sp. 2012CJ41-6]|uniref:AAA family ATPase n=1 Tax=Ruegeria spongiae TaxID=2942209 RepID=A0ABT0Q8U0_9RHOB|nr:adenylate/guanylate cyclase domain-containing protein [Ruegeria spongiae]MCL6285987.1 AAA family ATPase [Ruegeria spongiae]